MSAAFSCLTASEQSMPDNTHEALVGSQFGSRAEAYLNSAVHAQSLDLDGGKGFG